MASLNTSIRILCTLLLVSTSVSALCSKGCPSVNGTQIYEYFYSENKINFVPLELFYVQAMNDVGISTKFYQNIMCPIQYVAPTEVLGQEYGFFSLFAFRNVSSNRTSSFEYSFYYNKTQNAYAVLDENRKVYTYIKSEILYINAPYFVTYSCMPLDPKDPETCFYSWSIQSARIEVDKRKLWRSLKVIKEKGLDVGNSTRLYKPRDCIWKS